MVPGAGVEPAHCCQYQILSLARLPFRHPGRGLVFIAVGLAGIKPDHK